MQAVTRNINFSIPKRAFATSAKSTQGSALRKQLRALPETSETAPKRPASAYSLFVKENYSKGSGFAALGKKWKALSQAEAKAYYDEAAKLFEKYKVDFEKYLSRRSPADFIIEQKKHELKQALKGRSIPKPVHLKQDSKAPTKGRSAYMLFYIRALKGGEALQQKLLGRSLASLDVPAKAKAVAAVWSSVPSKVKAEFEELAAKEQERYRELQKKYQSQHNIQETQKTLKKILKAAVTLPKKVVKKPVKKVKVVKKKVKVVKKAVSKKAKKPVSKKAKN